MSLFFQGIKTWIFVHWALYWKFIPLCGPKHCEVNSGSFSAAIHSFFSNNRFDQYLYFRYLCGKCTCSCTYRCVWWLCMFIFHVIYVYIVLCIAACNKYIYIFLENAIYRTSLCCILCGSGNRDNRWCWYTCSKVTFARLYMCSEDRFCNIHRELLICNVIHTYTCVCAHRSFKAGCSTVCLVAELEPSGTRESYAWIAVHSSNWRRVLPNLPSIHTSNKRVYTLPTPT